MYGSRSGAQKGLPAGRRNVACRARVDYDGSNGPYFNNDKSPWFNATTDTAGLEDLTVRYHRKGSISWLLSYRWSCPLLDPTGRFNMKRLSKPLGCLHEHDIFYCPPRCSTYKCSRSCHRIKSTAFFFYCASVTMITLVRACDTTRTILMIIRYYYREIYFK